MVAAFMTAFYMVRLMVMTFYGEYRGAGHDPYGLTVPSEVVHHAAAHDDGPRARRPWARPRTHGPKEVPWNMWLPVFILAVLALVGGFLNIPHSLHWIGSSHFSGWIAPLLFQAAPVEHEAAPAMEYVLMAVATLVWAPAAMFLAWCFYGKDPAWSRPKAFVKRFPTLFRG